MPVNMDPKKRRPRAEPQEVPAKSSPQTQDPARPKTKQFGVETNEDCEKALADAEWKNLWDATEVIDMDKW
ncbi:MAG: hypothetical protein E6K63_03810 [Nitrospirae bacterium]|nr:MAG: hypothetical protein E6K63_03810 [Nitrospirota bacterium]